MGLFFMTTGSISTSIGGSSGPLYATFQKTWSGADDPVLKRAENPYNVSIISKKRNRWTQYTDGYCYPWTAYDLFQPEPYFYIQNANEATSKTLTKLADKIRGHSFDLGNYLVEGRETVRMSRQILGRLARGFHAIRKKDASLFIEALGNPKNRSLGTTRKLLSTKSVAAQHLELVYGVMPLMEDVHESGKAWETIANRFRKFTVKAGARSAGLEIIEPSYISGFTHLMKSQASVRIKATIEEINPLRSLGLMDPRGIIWEGVPFSFVVDWFIPIGNYLDVLNLIPHLQGTATTSTYVKSTSELTTVRTATCRGPGWAPWDPNKPFSVGTRIDFTRSVGSAGGLEIPPPEFKPLVKAMSPVHIWNAIALARSLLPK